MTLHPQSRVLLEALAGEPAPSLDRVEADRAEARELALAGPRTGLDRVVDLDADGVPVRLYRPKVGAPVALYVHGGGWVFHDLETHDAFCRELAHVTGWALLAVDQRRAPEHPYPAPLDDVEIAARWLRGAAHDQRVDATWLPAIGDSSGANLIAGLCVRDPGLLDFQALLYPPVDRDAELGAEPDALSGADMQWYWDAYAPDDVERSPEVSPARAQNLADHPPALVVTAEHDVLAPQGRAYAAALAEAGVEAVGLEVGGMVHSFWRQPASFDASRALMTMVGALLDARRNAAAALP